MKKFFWSQLPSSNLKSKKFSAEKRIREIFGRNLSAEIWSAEKRKPVNRNTQVSKISAEMVGRKIPAGIFRPTSHELLIVSSKITFFTSTKQNHPQILKSITKCNLYVKSNRMNSSSIPLTCSIYVPLSDLNYFNMQWQLVDQKEFFIIFHFIPLLLR